MQRIIVEFPDPKGHRHNVQRSTFNAQKLPKYLDAFSKEIIFSKGAPAKVRMIEISVAL